MLRSAYAAVSLRLGEGLMNRFDEYIDEYVDEWCFALMTVEAAGRSVLYSECRGGVLGCV